MISVLFYLEVVEADRAAVGGGLTELSAVLKVFPELSKTLQKSGW